MSQWAICSKKRAIRSFAHFLWVTWVIRSDRSLKKREWANRSGFFKRTKKYDLSQICLERNLLWTNRSFIMSDLSKLLTVAHLSWDPWAISSRLLFLHERPERFAHSCSFVLSESLTAAHLIWVIWANEQSANERIPSPGSKSEYSAILSWIKPLSHVRTVLLYVLY